MLKNNPIIKAIGPAYFNRNMHEQIQRDTGMLNWAADENRRYGSMYMVIRDSLKTTRRQVSSMIYASELTKAISPNPYHLAKDIRNATGIAKSESYQLMLDTTGGVATVSSHLAIKLVIHMGKEKNKYYSVRGVQVLSFGVMVIQ